MTGYTARDRSDIASWRDRKRQSVEGGERKILGIPSRTILPWYPRQNQDEDGYAENAGPRGASLPSWERFWDLLVSA